MQDILLRFAECCRRRRNRVSKSTSVFTACSDSACHTLGTLRHKSQRHIATIDNDSRWIPACAGDDAATEVAGTEDCFASLARTRSFTSFRMTLGVRIPYPPQKGGLQNIVTSSFLLQRNEIGVAISVIRSSGVINSFHPLRPCPSRLQERKLSAAWRAGRRAAC